MVKKVKFVVETKNNENKKIKDLTSFVFGHCYPGSPPFDKAGALIWSESPFTE